MKGFTLIIAVVALVIAIAAFARTGGIEDIRALLSRQMEMTTKTAEGLKQLEQLFHKKDDSKPE
ncbi:MAG: hypothetical protein ACE5FK_05830 [Candidatus Methylomirabilia bacterium]